MAVENVREESLEKKDPIQEVLEGTDPSKFNFPNFGEMAKVEYGRGGGGSRRNNSRETSNSRETNKPNRLTKEGGRYNGPSGPETWYDLDMTNIVKDMKNRGYTEAKGYKYHVRKDGVKMFGDYVMVAANLKTRPKGTVLDTSLGKGIVCDTGGFVRSRPNGLDIATNWKRG